ncbi:hypothetical protein [Ochrobactrum sp. 3-3]|uniref:hypothetical protein n=1 Tax=Ochrobactrum sp. 3-3 TaxID=1830124 RepID=UPI000DEF8D33|nr:hypothetical protein [Ochrobactrum sp. 3-3]
MPSKEYEALVEKVARDLATLNEGTEDTWENYHADAQKACSTIRAALKEPNEAMKEAWDLDTGRWISEEIEDPYHPWRVMLAASALGEQSE